MMLRFPVQLLMKSYRGHGNKIVDMQTTDKDASRKDCAGRYDTERHDRLQRGYIAGTG